MNVGLFFDNHFNFFSTKAKINKIIINLDGLKALKRQIPDVWLKICLSHFEIGVTWRPSKLLLRLHSHISVWYGVFVAFKWFPSFRFWVYSSKQRARNHEKSLFLGEQSSYACGSGFWSLF